MKTAILYLLITIWISFPVKSEDKREHFRSICRFIHRLFHFKTDFLQFEASGEKNEKAVKIQTILSWNIPVGDKYLFLLAQRNLFYQIYPLHSEITQRISHKKNKTTHKYFIVLLGVSHLRLKNVSIKSFKHLVFIIQSSKSPVIKIWNHMKLRT